MIKPATGPCEAVDSMTTYTVVKVLRAVKCGQDGQLTHHTSFGRAGLILCPAHKAYKGVV